jgi:NADH dehydrogenase (ubiquinone) 1 beta subcomplex subunit 8
MLVNLLINPHLQLHAEIDLYGQDRYGSAEPLRYSIPFQYACFLSVMAACFGIYYFLEDKKMFRPVTPRQYPSTGPHYSFETK